MINADEHKKLLEQITDLERNSINYFDVEQEFFLIDSDNLTQVRPQFNNSVYRQDLRSMDMDSDNPLQVRSHLCGYSIQGTGIYDNDNLTPEAIDGLNGRGAYVYVEVKGSKITIKQDLNGSWGLYLFRHGDYFAISNSFFRLLDHVKFKYPLTINRDYCHHFLANDLCSHAYSETAVNEIKLLERNAAVRIDVVKKSPEIELINYKEHSIQLDSPEAMAILDNWVELWANILRGIAQRTQFIQADLSGGFDSRMSLLTLLHSGIDLNKIKINSYKSTNQPFKEDYEISSKIAEHYGFKLNRAFPERQALNYSLSDIWNLSSYAQQPFHKMSYLSSGGKPVDKVYYVSGHSGETIRGNWLRFNQSSKEFTESQASKTNSYSRVISRELSQALRNIMGSAFNSIADKYNISDPDSHYLVQYLYQETRSRSHFGKEFVINYLRNRIVLAPTLDPELHKVKFDTPECPDPRLLMALICVRYESDLLTFPFQGGRSIVPETIEYAKKINERFPHSLATNKVDGESYHLSPRDKKVEQLLNAGKNNPNVPDDLPQRCLKASFESSKTYSLFTSQFDSEIYNKASAYYDNNQFGRERPMYGVVGITRVIEDVQISQRNHSSYRDMLRFIEQDFATVPDDKGKLLSKVRKFLTARVDIKLITTEGDFQVVVSDEKVAIRKPKWMQRNCVGYQIQSYAGDMQINAKATVDGKVELSLVGLDVRRPEDKSKRIPYWIDYTKLIVNGKTIFDELTPAWHDKPYLHTFNVKAGEEIKIQVEWLPHRSDT